MSETANLVFKIDSTDVTRGKGELDKLTEAGGRTEEAAKRVQRSWEQAVQRVASEMTALNSRVDVLNGTQSKMLAAVERVSTQMDRMTAAYERSTRAAERASRTYGDVGREATASATGVDRVNRSLTQTEASATAAGASIRRHLLVALSGLSAMRIIDQADNWGQMASRIRMATESADEYERVQTRMVESANRTYRGITETREAFVQLSPVLRQMGMTLDESIDAIDTFSGLMVVNAASADRGADAMRALSVALQKGKLDADGWITIYSTLDSIVDVLADHSGMAAEEIRKLGASGKLSVEMIAQALAGQMDTVMAQVDEMPTTVRDAMNNVGNAFTDYIGKANEVNGVTATMADGILVLGENLTGVLNVALVAGAAGLTRYTAGMLAAAAQTAAGTVQTRLAAAEELKLAQAQMAAAQASMAQTRAMQGLTATMAQQTAAANTLAAAEQRLTAAKAASAAAGRGLLAVLGGPAGIAITAGLAATAFMTMGGSARAASVDVDGLASSIGDLTQKQLELRRLELDEQVAALEEKTIESSRAVQGLQRDYEALSAAAARGANITVAELENVRRAILEQEVAHEQNSSALTKARHLLDQIVVRLGDLDSAARGAAAGVQSLNDVLTNDAGAKYLERLADQSLTAGLKTQRDRLNALVEAGKLVFTPEDLKKAQDYADKIDRAATSVRSGTKAISEAARAAKQFEQERQRHIRSQYQEISNLSDQADALEDQVRYYGLSESALNDLTIARLREQQAALTGIEGAEEEIAIRERMIEQYQRIGLAMQGLEAKEAEKAAWESWSRDVEQIFQQVGQSLTDAIFEGGKSGRELVKDLFKTLTLRVLINPVMGAIQGAVVGSFGPGGVGNMAATGGNSIGGLGSITSLFTGNGIGMGISNALTSLSTSSALAGTGVGNYLMGTAGNVAGMSNLALGGAGLLGGIGANLLFDGKGYSSTGGSLGATAGMVFGGPIGAIAGGLIGGGLGSLFGDDEPKTRHGQRTTIDYMGGRFGVSAVDDRQAAGSEQAALAAAQASVTAANELFAKLGVNAAIESFYAVMESSVLGDRQGVASGGMLRTGDDLRQIGIRQSSDMTFAGFGGWSSAEMLPRLATDIQLSILEAFQTQVDSLPDVLADMIRGVDVRALDAAGAQELAARFSAMVQGVTQFQTAVESLPFDQLRELSFGAAAGLIEAAGGLERLTGNLNTYYENFHTEAERNAQTLLNVGKALQEVGVALPDTRQQFRALVEAQDLTTDAGRRVYAALLSVSGAFASVTQSAEQAAQESQRIAEQNRQTLIGNLESAYSAAVSAGQAEIARLQQSFGATDTAMNAYRSAVQALESEFASLFTSIDRYISDLRGNVEASAQAQYRQARAVISTAIATGQLPQTADLTEALQVAQRGVTSQVYGSLFEQNRAYAILANEMEALKGIAEPELDAAKATLAQLEEQYALLRGTNRIAGDSLSAIEQQVRLAFATEEAARHEISLVEQQLELAKQQHEKLMEALTGIDGGIKSLAEAMADFASAVAAAQKVVSGGGGGGGAGTPAAIDAATRYYNSNPDVVAEFNSGTTGMGYDQYAAWHYEKYGQFEGRSYAVGTSYVPHDMSAQIHQGEIIIDPRSSDILRRYGIGVQAQGGADRETAQLLREQLTESREQNRYLREMLKNLIRTAHNTEDTANAVGAHSPSDDVVMVF